MIGEDGTGWGKTVLAPIIETVPMFWFCVNMGAWLVMGMTLYRYMQRLGDMADDVLLMQLKPLNLKLRSIDRLRDYIDSKDLVAESLELTGPVHKRTLTWEVDGADEVILRRWGGSAPKITLQCDEANGFLLGATLEFKDKTRLVETLSSAMVQQGQAGTDFGLVENMLKTVFFQELVNAGVIDRDVMKLLRSEQEHIANPERWAPAKSDDWLEAGGGEEDAGVTNESRRDWSSKNTLPKPRPSSPTSARNGTNRLGRPIPQHSVDTRPLSGKVADERQALSRASRAASVAKSRTQQAEKELQLMARELSARRAQLQQAEAEADRLVQQLIRG